MAKHYSIRDFFRQMANALLARYFQSKLLFENPDFISMKETKPDALFEAGLSLPHGRCNMLEIFDMCNENGFLAVLDLEVSTKDYKDQKAVVDKLEAEIKGKEKEIEKSKEEVEKKKTENAKLVKTGIK